MNVRMIIKQGAHLPGEARCVESKPDGSQFRIPAGCSSDGRTKIQPDASTKDGREGRGG